MGNGDAAWIRDTGCTEAQWRVMFAISLDVYDKHNDQYAGKHCWSTMTPELWRCDCGLEARLPELADITRGAP